jgi:AcrR family transcriptional regulator
MARRSEHSLEEIREMVLGTAEAIVINEGYAALNARKIAMEIGYTVGSIYMVFTNMADLTLHIKARALDDIALHLQQVQDLEAGLCIEELAKTYLRYVSRNFNRWNMVFEHRLPKDSGTFEWYQQKVDNVFNLVENQFTKLNPECSDSQKKRAARALWAGVHGICVLSLSGSLDVVGIDDLEESVVLLVRSFLRG